MPGAAVSDPLHGRVPPWLDQTLASLQLQPASAAISGGEDGPFLTAIGKKLSDLLGTVFRVNPGGAKPSGVPRRLSLATWNPGKDEVGLHPSATPHDTGMVSPGVEAAPFAVSPLNLDQLLQSGHLEIQQPPQTGPAGVDAIQRRLREVLDAAGPEYKAAQVAKRLR